MSKDCHDTALSYIEHRERSCFELKSHLSAKGFREEEIEAELQFLKELRYVDDERYCQDYCRYAIQKGRGPVRIQLELKEKGIDSDLIRCSLEDHFDRRTEKEAAWKEAKKLLPASDRPDEKTIAKVGRKLSSLGYHTEIIYDVIGQIRKSGDAI